VTDRPVALVTGASRGIGAAIARRFAEAGAAVAVTARTTEVTDERLPGTIHETVDSITTAGGRAVAIAANLADAADREQLVADGPAQLDMFDDLLSDARPLLPAALLALQASPPGSGSNLATLMALLAGLAFPKELMEIVVRGTGSRCSRVWQCRGCSPLTEGSLNVSSPPARE